MGHYAVCLLLEQVSIWWMSLCSSSLRWVFFSIIMVGVIKFSGFMLNVIMLSVILHKANMLNGMLSLFKVSLWCVSLCRMPWPLSWAFSYRKKIERNKKTRKTSPSKWIRLTETCKYLKTRQVRRFLGPEGCAIMLYTGKACEGQTL
jgi:hypothetical protein